MKKFLYSYSHIFNCVSEPAMSALDIKYLLDSKCKKKPCPYFKNCLALDLIRGLTDDMEYYSSELDFQHLPILYCWGKSFLYAIHNSGWFLIRNLSYNYIEFDCSFKPYSQVTVIYYRPGLLNFLRILKQKFCGNSNKIIRRVG